ncbi:MAG: hypothetical protein K0B01_04110 [Syntrophobacterales bacterium]|nr:hypothetical protein [Syntrophobacterales bacterium]
MAQLPSPILVIFDYSGTLSSEAPDFGRPENLASALAASGLAAFGVTDANIFWEKIIFPTWAEGSRTTIGYARVIADRIASLHLSHRAPGAKNEVSCSSVEEAAQRFVTMYLDHSRMDLLWRPLLENLYADRNTAVVIATDHYAEATGAIIRYLRKWGITATKAESNAASQPESKQMVTAAARGRETFPGKSEKEARFSSFIVANSADLGFWKAERRFWELLAAQLSGRFRSVLIVDDFGFNEADANGYGKLALVRDRRLKTKAVLRDVFQTSASTISFFLKNDEGSRKGDRTRKIRAAIRRIKAAVLSS